MASVLDDSWPEDGPLWENPTWRAQVAADAADAEHAMSDEVLIGTFAGTLRLAKTTQHKYTRCLWEFKDFLDTWGIDSVRSAHRRDVQRFLAWLDGDSHASPRVVASSPEQGRREARDQLSPSSRKGYLSALRAFYRFCLDEEYPLRHYDPTVGVRSPKVTHTPGLTLTADELQRFLDATGSERDRIQAYLLVFTAQRAGALRELRWRDVNWEERELTFHGKGDKVNVLPIHDELLGALSRWRRVLLDEAERNPLVAAALYDERTAHVLLTRRGRPVTVQTLGKQAKWRAARAGLRLHVSDNVYRENKSQVHPHAFRRSWATLQRRRGVALEDIADVLAHASTDTTRKHYAFPPSDAKRRAVKNFSL